MEATIDHAIFFHDHPRNDSLFFVICRLDTGDTARCRMLGQRIAGGTRGRRPHPIAAQDVGRGTDDPQSGGASAEAITRPAEAITRLAEASTMQWKLKGRSRDDDGSPVPDRNA
ncbi:hypothetical protein, partial [Brevibacterium sp. 2SA]|uniref:hypothetical protein n=1 Tax=Brevibacterium sp. 2SA TaxID=2502198 RepID=UPI001BB22CFF